MTQRRHETPLKRTNPSGKTVWVARYTGRDGKRRSAGTFRLEREAQAAIDAAYEKDAPPSGAVTVGGYFDGWLSRHPRTERTDVSYSQRVRYVLDVQLDGRAFRDWPIADVERRQANDLLDHMLRVQKRAAGGARGILRVLSAMWQDAIDDGHVRIGNPFMGLKVRANDPRVQKAPRRIRVWSWEQMHDFCAKAGEHEAMLRVLSDCGLRIGELFPLERQDLHLGAGRCGEHECQMEGPHLHVRRTAWRGRVEDGTKTDHGQPDAGRACPVAPGLQALLEAMPRRIDTRILFPGPSGWVWGDRRWYDVVWYPTLKAAGYAVPGDETTAKRPVGPTPHEFRHSYVSLMRAAGVDPADLASWTGHTVLTATQHYTHSTGQSLELGRKAVG